MGFKIYSVANAQKTLRDKPENSFYKRHKRFRAYGLEMSLAFHIVFILALMAHIAKGLPTTKQTAIERPTILRKSQPTIGEPSASRWPSLAEVITNAGNGIKPSTSLLDMLHNEKKIKTKIDTSLAVEEINTTSASPLHHDLSNEVQEPSMTMASTAAQVKGGIQ